MIWIIDRIENNYAIAECGTETFNIPLFALPKEVKPGDIVSVDINKSETAKRKEFIQKKMDNLFKK